MGQGGERFVAMETRYTNLVSEVNTEKSAPQELHQELRRRILGLTGVAERQNAGIHEDAFFVGGTMFMHTAPSLGAGKRLRDVRCQ